MKKCFLTGLLLILFSSAYSQQSTRHLGDSVFVIAETAVKDSFSFPAVQLRLDTICFHEHSTNNSSLAVFRIVNKTNCVFFVPMGLICWDDSGFQSNRYGFSPDAMHKVAPGQSVEVKVQIRGTTKRNWSKSGYFAVFLNGQPYDVPILLRLLMSPAKCAGPEGRTNE